MLMSGFVAWLILTLEVVDACILCTVMLWVCWEWVGIDSGVHR